MCPFRNHIRTWQWVLSRQDENGGKGPVSLFLDRQRVDFVHRRQGRRANDLPQHAELRAGPRSGNHEPRLSGLRQPGYPLRDKGSTPDGFGGLRHLGARANRDPLLAGKLPS